jgi:SAM-dependent methyltransferase
MTETLEATKPDLVVVKQRQQQAWASGDFAVVAARIVLVAEQLCDTADLRAGWRVLDVATGTGNAAIAAARLGCTAVGVDYVPALLERGRRRAAAEGLEVQLVEGDAESLPFRGATFDAVTSVFGCMFAPDHAQASAELLRVCRPGGTIALASWTPDGFIGELFRTIAAHVPPPPGVPSPMLWGTESHLRELLGEDLASLEVEERTFTFRFRSAQEFVTFFRTWYGPTLKAFAALEGSARDALESDLLALANRFDRLGRGAIAIPATYTEAVALTRGGTTHAP